MGWGAIIKDEVEDLKEKFEVCCLVLFDYFFLGSMVTQVERFLMLMCCIMQTEMDGDEKKLFEYWPQAFRWTCCGVSAEMTWGCDHHGSGRKPCTCDFCK